MPSSASSRTSTNREADLQRRSLRHEATFAGMIGALLSVLAFGYCFPRHMLLLYGDAVAHMHIARRILDSLEPGIRQIGSVWLPFPHLLMIPFVMRLSWWQNGIAGAIPSMASYILSVAGLWRLARYWLRPAGAVVATLFFALNPGLLYMQTTAMNEPLFLCQMIWATLFLMAYLRSLSTSPRCPGQSPGQSRPDSAPLVACGLVLVTAIYTRYDGWIFASIVWLIALHALWRARAWKSRAGGAFVLFTAMLATAPILWFAWNARQYGDWLDFMRGPYSAAAIERRSTPPGSFHYPGWHNLWEAGLYFLKAAESGAIPARWGDLLFILALAGTVAAIVKWRKRQIAPFLLLWLPLPFYSYSVAYGSVPIFIPLWFPHSYYNTRYGMELLPAFALGLGFLVARLVKRSENRWPQHAPLVLLVFIVAILVDTAVLIHRTPLVLAEAIANSRTRIPFEEAYGRALNQLPRHGMILAWTSDHIGAFQDAGIPLRRTINETDYYAWRDALQHPARSAQWIVAAEHDAVSQAIEKHPEGLTVLDIVCSSGQPCVKFYKSNLYQSSAPAGGTITPK